MKQRSTRRQVAALVGGVLVGAVIGVAIARATDSPTGRSMPMPVSLLLALLVYLACILIHEIGHLAAGALAGFRPLLLVVGPLRVERANGRTDISLNRSVSLAGGIALCTPVGVHDLRRRTMVMAAGGPLASLLSGVQCLAIWMALSQAVAAPASATAGVSDMLLFAGFASLGIGILTLLPMRVGGFYSDGARILRLLRQDEETEREVALMALTGLTLGGARPRDWDAGLVRSAAGIRDGGAFEVSGLQFAHLHALDTGDITAARTYLEETLARVDQLPKASRGPVQLGAAVFFALYDRDPARARALFDAAGPGEGLLRTPHQRPLAEAALLLAEGNVDAAATAAASAQEMMQRAADRGSTAVDAAHAETILSAAGAAPGSQR